MKLIVGLGNPGVKYQKTRHNIGFMVVEKFLKNFESVEKTIWVNEVKFKSDTVNIYWQPRHGEEEKVILAKPKTYMNNSGLAVSLMASYYKMLPSDIWIVYDDIDLPLGNMKMRFAGASAGHHGVESIMEKLGTDKFWRFRMGTGTQNLELDPKNKKDIDDFVLGEFRGSERGKVKELIKRGAQAIGEGLEHGLEAAMNRFNTR